MRDPVRRVLSSRMLAKSPYLSSEADLQRVLYLHREIVKREALYETSPDPMVTLRHALVAARNGIRSSL